MHSLHEIPSGGSSFLKCFYSGSVVYSRVARSRSLCLLMEDEMLTETEVHKFAGHWVEAWNSHDLEEIMSHYASDVVLVSPVEAKILNDPSGQ